MSGTSVSYGNMRPSLSHRKVTVLRALRRWDATLSPCHLDPFKRCNGGRAGHRIAATVTTIRSAGAACRDTLRFEQAPTRVFWPGVEVKRLKRQRARARYVTIATFIPACVAAERCATCTPKPRGDAPELPQYPKSRPQLHRLHLSKWANRVTSHRRKTVSLFAVGVP